MTVVNQNISDGLGEEMVVNGDPSVDEPLDSNDIATIPSLEEQKNIIREDLNKPLVNGDTWYLLDLHWYKQWKKYVDLHPITKDEIEHPGPIYNTTLFDLGATNRLREHLLAGCDYKLVSDVGWNYLVQWFGLTAGQGSIARKVVEHGLYNKETKVEVYLIELKLCLFKSIDNVHVENFSKVTIIADVVKRIKAIFDIPDSEETRVWNKFMTNTYELINKLENTLQDTGIGSGQVLVLEQKNENNEWPRQTRSRSLSSSNSSMAAAPTESGYVGSSTPTYSSTNSSYNQFSSSYNNRQRYVSSKPGLCGLGNLGNTCFMNSALQCLSNTTPLTKFFMSDTYKHELNPTNPLGMRGKIAEAYADLMHQMWGGQNSYVTPRQFKMQVGRFAPQFSGYQQQDSHELLAFLLDGLHEDLSRVKQKPYIELKDDNERPDEVVAVEAWKNHSLRNSSIIVDYFHGQFKSTVECPECGKRSITFDPFCYLSLPLPIKKERSLTVTFVSLDSLKKPVKLKVTVPKMGCTTDLCNAIAKITGVETDKLIVTDVFHSIFHKRFKAGESLSHITDRDDIYIYEIPINASKVDTEELLVLPVYLREIRQPASTYSYSHTYNTLFGIPLLIPVPRESTTTADVYQIILRAMRRFVQVPTLDSQSVDDSLKGPEQNGKEKDEDMADDSDDAEEYESKVKEDGKGKNGNDEEDKIELKSQPQVPATLFEITVVNTSGNQNIQTLQHDNEYLKLTAKTHLAIDWYPKLKKKYYDEKKAEEIEEHESLNAPSPSKKTIQLSDCLELFLQKEKLGEEDPWYCPDCKEHRQAYKKFDLWTLPKILVIHLKRFSYNRFWRDKLDALVNFPIQQFDLTDYVINKNHPRAVYDLHAVSNHYGGLGGGHYTAYGINCYDGQWYYFDDSSVSSSDASSPISKAAYVLFYTRRDDPDNEIMNISELITEDANVFDGEGEDMES